MCDRSLYYLSVVGHSISVQKAMGLNLRASRSTLPILGLWKRLQTCFRSWFCSLTSSFYHSCCFGQQHKANKLPQQTVLWGVDYIRSHCYDPRSHFLCLQGTRTTCNFFIVMCFCSLFWRGHLLKLFSLLRNYWNIQSNSLIPRFDETDPSPASNIIEVAACLNLLGSANSVSIWRGCPRSRSLLVISL